MSTVTYKCNVCKREIKKLENKSGLTVFSRCIITDGCRGNLNKISVDPDNIRESFPAPVSGIQDWFPRRVFYEHNQNVPSREWIVDHNLSVNPTVSVFSNDSGVISELNQDDYTVSIIDKNSISIAFSSPINGIAHCLAKTSIPNKPSFIVPDVPLNQVTGNGFFVFAVPQLITKSENTMQSVPFNTLNETIQIEIEVIKPNEEPVTCFEELDGDLNDTAWQGWDTVLVRNRRKYNLKAKSIDDFRTFSDIQSLDEDIPNGTIIRFLRIDYGDGVWQVIPSRGLFMFLSEEPHQSVDKIKDNLIDIGEMLGSKNDFFVYRDGEVFVDVDNIEVTYPNIKNSS